MLVGILTILMHGYNIVCAVLTCVYPMMQSITAIEATDDKVKQKWLSFWCVFGIFQTIEMFFGFLLNYIPYYSWVRIMFFIFLMHPTTNGAQVLYESLFKKFLQEH